MDYVYVCRVGENEELRYSLRSIEKNLPEGRVWLVGYKPDWYTGDFISSPNKSTKFQNIKDCIGVAARDDRISDNFVFMNDDFFAVQKMDSIPVQHGGLLKDKIRRYQLDDPGSGYLVLLNKTLIQLRRLGINDPLDYDIHTPMIFNREGILRVIDEPGLIRSLYGNTQFVNGNETQDVKTYAAPKYKQRSYDFINGDLPYISTDDVSFNAVYESILKDMFVDPSRFES